MECRVRLESLELALELARKQAKIGIPSIEVKKELIEQGLGVPEPEKYQGDAGSTAEKALDVDNMLV